MAKKKLENNELSAKQMELFALEESVINGSQDEYRSEIDFEDSKDEYYKRTNEAWLTHAEWN